MAWVEIFVLFATAHLVGDYLLQTDWQAKHKRGGLGRDPVARRALAAHITTYTLAFVPVLVWLADDLGFGVVWVTALLVLPHLVQDNGDVVEWWMSHVKGAEIHDQPLVALAVDQAMHVVVLLVLALAAGA
jgi:hypothetical protein